MDAGPRRRPGNEGVRHGLRLAGDPPRPPLSGHLQPRREDRTDAERGRLFVISEGLPFYYASPVLAGDFLFGMSIGRGCFFCLDARTGETRWQGPARLGRTDRHEANASI